MEELKEMVTQVVLNGKNAAYKQFSIEEKKPEEPAKKEKQTKTRAKKEVKTPKATLVPSDEMIGNPCPACGKGTVLKGKTAYGCSDWKNGCAWRLDF